MVSDVLHGHTCHFLSCFQAAPVTKTCWNKQDGKAAFPSPGHTDTADNLPPQRVKHSKKKDVPGFNKHTPRRQLKHTSQTTYPTKSDSCLHIMCLLQQWLTAKAKLPTRAVKYPSQTATLCCSCDIPFKISHKPSSCRGRHDSKCLKRGTQNVKLEPKTESESGVSSACSPFFFYQNNWVATCAVWRRHRYDPLFFFFDTVKKDARQESQQATSAIYIHL